MQKNDNLYERTSIFNPLFLILPCDVEVEFDSFPSRCISSHCKSSLFTPDESWDLRKSRSIKLTLYISSCFS